MQLIRSWDAPLQELSTKCFFVCLFVLYDAVNGSDLRKVREWLEVRGPVSCDNYQMAHYLQAVA